MPKSGMYYKIKILGAIYDINIKNEFYNLYIDVSKEKYNKIIRFITGG